MTNIKAKGFDSPAQLREHLDELDVETPAKDDAGADPSDNIALQKEVAWLRKDVADLYEQIAARQDSSQRTKQKTDVKSSPFLGLATTAATTFILGRLFSHFRFGVLGPAVAPVIAAQLHRRWK